MRRIVLVSALALILLVTFVPVSNAEMAKEGSTTATAYYVSTYPNTLPQVEGTVQVNYQAIGIQIADDESSPMHYSTANCVGAAKVEKGVSKEMGLCTSLTPDGDKIYASYEATGKMGGAVEGTYKIVGGTGKCEGITGSGEFTRKPLKPPTKEHHVSIATHKYSWKIP